MIQIFLAGRTGRTNQPKVVQEVLADLKREHVPKQYLLTKLPGGRWTRVHNHKIGLGHVEAHGAGGGAAQSKDFSNIKEKSVNAL